MESPIKRISGKIGEMDFSYSMPDKSNLAIVQNGMMPLGAKPGVVYRNLGYITLRTHAHFCQLANGSFEFTWDISPLGKNYIRDLKNHEGFLSECNLIVNFPTDSSGIEINFSIDENNFLKLVFDTLPDDPKKSGKFLMPIVRLATSDFFYDGYIYKNENGQIVNFVGACAESKLQKPKLVHTRSCPDVEIGDSDGRNIRDYLEHIFHYTGILQLQQKSSRQRTLSDGRKVNIKRWRNVSISYTNSRAGVFRLRYHVKGSRNIKSDWVVFWFSDWTHKETLVQEL